MSKHERNGVGTEYMISITERIQGSLWGLVYGDVLGAPVETWSKDQIRQVFGRYQAIPAEYRKDKMKSAGVPMGRLQQIGLHTDDTQQALALLHSTYPEWDITQWANLLVAGTKCNAWRGTGRYFRAAVERLKKETLPLKAGSPSEGIGAAMRTGPLGARYRSSVETLRRVVFESSYSTHRTMNACMMAYSVASAVRHFISGEDQVLKAVIADLRETDLFWRDNYDISVEGEANHIIDVLCYATKKGLELPPEALRGRIIEYGSNTNAAINDGHALLGGVHALVMALRPGEPQEILVDVIQQGKDTDTVGAICGSILGARFGSSWIKDPGFLKSDIQFGPMLAPYVNALVAEKAEPCTIAGFLQRETRLTMAAQNL